MLFLFAHLYVLGWAFLNVFKLAEKKSGNMAKEKNNRGPNDVV